MVKSIRGSIGFVGSMLVLAVGAMPAQAGDVVAFQKHGRLEILEPTSEFGTASAVQISQLANGHIRVKGILNQDGGKTRVNDNEYVDFADVVDLFLYLRGGRDTVNFVANSDFKGLVSIDTASPTETGEADADSIVVGKIFARRGLHINTGPGMDLVDLTDTRVGETNLYHLNINTGSGLDRVRVTGVNNTVSVMGHANIRTNAGEENESVRGWQEFVSVRNMRADRNLHIAMGNGNDAAELNGVAVLHDFLLEMGQGDDRASLTSVIAGDDFTAHMGSGNDTLTAGRSQAKQLAYLGDEGTDTLSHTQDSHKTFFIRTGWETINGAPSRTVAPTAKLNLAPRN